MEGNQHLKAVTHLKQNLPPGTAILENSNERGQGGYKFPRTFNGASSEGVEYTADVFAIIPGYGPIVFESDGIRSGQGHFGVIANHKGMLRDQFFARFGIPSIRYPTPWIAELTEADIMADVAYHTEQLRKAVTAKPIISLAP